MRPKTESIDSEPMLFLAALPTCQDGIENRDKAYFTCSVKGKSSILSRNRCYKLWPLMTALIARGLYTIGQVREE